MAPHLLPLLLLLGSLAMSTALAAATAAPCPCEDQDALQQVVCGSDNKTYTSQCTLHCASSSATGLAAVHAGPCMIHSTSLRAARAVGAYSDIQHDLDSFINCVNECSRHYASVVPPCIRKGTRDCTATMQRSLQCWCDCEVPRQLTPTDPTPVVPGLPSARRVSASQSEVEACGIASTEATISCTKPCVSMTDGRERYECVRLCGKKYKEDSCRCSGASLLPTLSVLVGVVLAWLCKTCQ